MEPSSKLLALLARTFCKDGKVVYSGADTAEGTREDWRELIQLGLAKAGQFANLKTLRGPIGHRFSVEITNAGRQLFSTKGKP